VTDRDRDIQPPAADRNPYSPPVDAALPELPGDADEQIEATRPNGMVKAAVATTAAAGALLLLSSLYFGWGLLIWGFPAVYPFAVLGVVEVWLSLKIYRQRVWAAIAAVVVSGAIAAASSLWLVLLVLSGFFALMNVVLPLAALAATLLASLAIASCLRVGKIRRHLAAQGLDVDF